MNEPISSAEFSKGLSDWAWKHVHVRVHPDMKKELMKEAEEKKLLLSEYVRLILKERAR